MKTIHLFLSCLTLCSTPVFADLTPFQQQTANKFQNVKIHAGRDTLMWIGAGEPDDFDSSKLSEEEQAQLEENGIKQAEFLANNGVHFCQNQLAVYYYFEAKNYLRAIHWAEKAAAHGYEHSVTVLIVAHMQGNGVLPDAYEVFKYAHIASILGDKKSKELLDHIKICNLELWQKTLDNARNWLELNKETFYSNGHSY